MSYIFWSKNDRRLRAFLRLSIHTGLVFVVSGFFTLLLLIPAATLGNIDLGAITPEAAPLSVNALGAVGTLFGISIGTYLAARFVDRRAWQPDFGLRLDRQWWLDLLFGMALGIVLMAAIFAVEWGLGWVTITDTFTVTDGSSFGAALGLAIVLFLCVGIYEEILSRGYHMRNMAEGFRFMGPRAGLILAWVLSSAVFGVLHALNPNASLISTVNISLAGLMLGLPVLLSGRLGAAIGLHITWNFTQGNVFGFPVSGGVSPVTIIAIEQGGPDLLTGGAFGPEAGLIGVVAILTGSGLIVLWHRWQDGSITLHEAYTVYRTRENRDKEKTLHAVVKSDNA